MLRNIVPEEDLEQLPHYIIKKDVDEFGTKGSALGHTSFRLKREARVPFGSACQFGFVPEVGQPVLADNTEWRHLHPKMAHLLAFPMYPYQCQQPRNRGTCQWVWIQ